MSKFTIAALAVLGAASLSAPALARDKPAASPLNRLTPAMLKAAQAADTALTANDTATAEPLVAQAEAAGTSDADRYVAAALRYRLESAKFAAGQQASPNAPASQTALAKPLDALIANPVTPRADKARYAFQRGQLAYFGRQYAAAAQLFAHARELGYDGPELGLTSVRAKFDGGDLAGGATEMDQVIAAQAATGQPAPADYYRYAIARSIKGTSSAQAVTWMNRYAAAMPTAKTWYEILTAYGLQQGAAAKLDDAQKLDLYRLMRASGALPDQYAYVQYAQLARSGGVPQEAQSVLKEGAAKGKLSATDTEIKTLLTQTARPASAITALETKARTGTTGTTAMQAGDANLAAGNDAKAAALYGTALTRGGVDADTVNTHLGIALARAGDKVGAQAAFAAVRGAPRAEIASFWTTWLTTGAR